MENALDYVFIEMKKCSLHLQKNHNSHSDYRYIINVSIIVIRCLEKSSNVINLLFEVERKVEY